MRVDPTVREKKACLTSRGLQLCPAYRTTARVTVGEGAGEVSRGHSSPTGRRAESSNARSRGLDSRSVEQPKGTSHHGGWGDGGTETSSHGQQQALAAFDSQRALTYDALQHSEKPPYTTST